MKPTKSAKKKHLLPIDIRLPERTPLDGGAMFVVLPTLDELEAFWAKHREAFPFAAKGILYGDRQHYLNECEWVFAPSKAAVVATVFRWDQIGIQCEWYDWASVSPDDHGGFFQDRDVYRQAEIDKGRWSEANEAEYQEDCQRRSPETYRGWWRLTNLPNNLSDTDWFSSWCEETIDLSLPPEIAAQLLQEQTFDDWKRSDCDELEFHDQQSLDKEIAYWREEQRAGQDYYGSENEITAYPKFLV